MRIPTCPVSGWGPDNAHAVLNNVNLLIDTMLNTSRIKMGKW